MSEQAAKDAGVAAPEAVELLRGLVYGGKFLSLEALIALLRYSELAKLPEGVDAVAIARAYIAARPQLSELVYAELEKIGVILRDTAADDGESLEVG